MLRQWWKRHTDDADEGAATAEFAVVLPCVAAVASVRRELGGKWAAGLALWQCLIAWVVAFVFHGIGALL